MTKDIQSYFRKDRIEALADGIFATVMTILVLSLVVPTVTGANTSTTLQADVIGLLPDLFSYIITFIFLGMLWIGHQSSLSHIAKFDLKTMWINILLLLSVALVPFSTALLGRYPLQSIAVLVYGVNALVVTVLFNILFFYTRQRRLTHEEQNPEIAAKRSRVIIVGPIAYALAIGFSFVATEISLALYGSVTVYYILFGGRYVH
jgi:uncharacterized membrane protein